MAQARTAVLARVAPDIELAATRARIAAVVMQKGGVGKTTVTICVARAALVYHKKRVLVVDFDPQGNTTSALAADKVELDQLTIADTIIPNPDATIDEVIVPTVREGVDLAPGGEPLAAAQLRIEASSHGREYRLQEALQPVLGNYDLVIIDNAPALGTLKINALTAADTSMLVVEADQWSGDGLVLLRKTLNGVLKYSNPQLTITGTVINKWRGTGGNKELVTEIVEGMRKHFPDVPVWLDRRIPLWQGIPDYITAGKGLDEGPLRLRALAQDVFKPIAKELLVGVS